MKKITQHKIIRFSRLIMTLALLGGLKTWATSKQLSCDVIFDGNKRPAVVFAEHYSSSLQYYKIFRDLGYRVYHVLPSQVRPEYAKGSNSFEYDGVFVWSDPDVRQKIKDLNPSIVLAGVENGVPIQDELNAFLKLPYANSLHLSSARREKFLMHEIARKKGIPVPEQALTSTVEEALQWRQQHGLWPVVLKPNNSAGQDGVYIVHNEAELRQKFSQVLGETNALGHHNTRVLIMEYLAEPEYAVQLVSRDGFSVVTDVWEYNKTKLASTGVAFYNYDRIVPVDNTRMRKVIKYAMQIADALEIKNGPTHFEIRFNSAGEPRLVEVGARLYGGGAQVISALAGARNQVESVVESILNPGKFKQLPREYQLKKHAYVIQLRSSKTGYMDVASFDFIKKLPSFYSMSLHPQFVQGKLMEPTTDLFDSPGSIMILHEDENVILKDLQTILSFRDSHGFVKETK